MMEFNSNGKLNFTGKALTLADLENSFKKEFGEELSEKALGSWRYFGFDLKNEWKAVMSGSEAIIVVDEACDLNMSSVFPDLDSFISWLEVTYDERETEKEAEREYEEREAEREAEKEDDKETEKEEK